MRDVHISEINTVGTLGVKLNFSIEPHPVKELGQILKISVPPSDNDESTRLKSCFGPFNQIVF